jgi:uncharacterized protein YegP (UPF0339 family)
MNMSHNDSRRTFPASPPTEPPRPNWNDRYEVDLYIGEDGDHRFRVKSRKNGQVVAVGEGYENYRDMEKTLLGLFPEATVPSQKAVEVPVEVEHPFDLQPFEED